MPTHMTRRAWLQVGALGGGLGLSRLLQLQALGNPVERTRRSGILVFLLGGPSHQDMFDMKPDAPAEFRGEFRPVATSVPGVRICEHLPRLAEQTHRLAIWRGISHNLAAHGLGTRYVLTGNRPTPVLRFPEMGSVVSREHPCPPDLPAFVSIDRQLEGAGYLGVEFGPLSTGEKPHPRRPFQVRGMTLGDGVTLDRFGQRRRLATRLDTAFSGIGEPVGPVEAVDRFAERAYQMISSPRAREAFNLESERAETRQAFGEHEFGLSMLLACRLVEAGVPFVTVILENWDTHQDNFVSLRDRLLPPFDRALAATIQTLASRGLWENTGLLVTGEFGRTPKVNGRSGRDHWAQAMTALLGGGAISGGQVVGETDEKAAAPVDEGASPDDLAATFLWNLGIDPHLEYATRIGRPVTLIRDGQVRQRLFTG